MTKSREQSGHPTRHVTFAMSERRPAYPSHAPDMDEDKDEDDKPLLRPASRKEPPKEKSDLETDDEDLLPVVPPRSPPVAPVRKERTQYGRTQLLHWNTRCQDSCQRTEDTSILCRKAESEALRNIISKLSEERNLRDVHLKHYHMSTAQFKKRTTHLDIPGRIGGLYRHVVKTYPFCSSMKPSRVSGLRAEEFGDLIFLDHGSAKTGDKTFGFLIVLDGATSHLTAYPCKSTSTSEAISKFHEWMDTFQMTPKGICADMAYHHLHDLQAYYRMHTK